jgi:hypothetical protein
MSDEKSRPRGPSEYAKNEPPRKPKAKTRFLFKFLGLLLVALAGWLVWYSLREGKLPDLTNEAQQKKMLAQAQQDLDKAEKKATDVSKTVVSWAEQSLDALRTRIKGKPPETKEEISDLVNESKREVAQNDGGFGGGSGTARRGKDAADKGGVEKGGPPAAPGAPPAPKSKGQQLLDEAREQYKQASAVYALADPAASQKVVQDSVHKAAPLFSKCLDLLEAARTNGATGGDIDTLEQAAAKRLYDCRKRMELTR